MLEKKAHNTTNNINMCFLPMVSSFFISTKGLYHKKHKIKNKQKIPAFLIKIFKKAGNFL